jgi:hypothetical protein
VTDNIDDYVPLLKHRVGLAALVLRNILNLLVGEPLKPSIIISRKAKRRKSSRPAWTKEQENRYRELAATLEQAGFLVRREELKRGHCWRAVSGACRSMAQRFIFVDSRLSPDEQVSFLSLKVSELSVSGEPDGAPLSAAA